MAPNEKATALAMLAAAAEKLSSARILHGQGYYNDALSRAYYAAFHAVSLLFFLGGRSFSRHGQLIGAFNKEFIATRILPKELGKALNRLYDASQSGDYDIFVKSDQAESEQGLSDAATIVASIIVYANENMDAKLPSIS